MRVSKEPLAFTACNPLMKLTVAKMSPIDANNIVILKNIL